MTLSTASEMVGALLRDAQEDGVITSFTSAALWARWTDLRARRVFVDKFTQIPVPLRAILPVELVEHILSLVDCVQTFGRARQVCREWREACEQVLWQEAQHAEACVERKEWTEAALTYRKMLAQHSRFAPALLGLEYVLQWQGRKAVHLLHRAEESGWHVRREVERYLMRSTQQNSSHSWYVHGRWLQWVCHNDTEATEWFRRAAARNHAGALMALASRGESDWVALVTHAADLKYPPALYKLGVCCATGVGVEEDRTRAVILWEEAAEAGHLGAMHSLADYLSDDAAANDWDRLADLHEFASLNDEDEDDDDED